jgi:FkbM family methyltransferase
MVILIQLLKFFAISFKTIGYYFYALEWKVLKFKNSITEKSITEINMERWYSLTPAGDKSLRLDYDLNTNSVVFDLGGYKGNWASDICNKYGCVVFIFEPVNDYFNQIVDRFKYNTKIKIFEFGLGVKDHELDIILAEEASSVFSSSMKHNNKDIQHQKIIIKSFINFIKSENLDKIDLLKINIEGGEYDLLESILESNIQNKIINFQIQFHDFVPNSEIRMKKIQDKLSQTHQITFNYPFVWENWKLKLQ